MKNKINPHEIFNFRIDMLCRAMDKRILDKIPPKLIEELDVEEGDSLLMGLIETEELRLEKT